MDSEPRPKVPHKLERYLLTIARRRSIERISVALFVIYDGAVVLGEDKALPSMIIGPGGIGESVCTILAKLGLDGEVRYIGYFDNGMARQYNFALDLESRPKLGREFALTEAAEAVSRLGPKDAKVVINSFGRPPVVHQMFFW